MTLARKAAAGLAQVVALGSLTGGTGAQANAPGPASVPTESTETAAPWRLTLRSDRHADALPLALLGQDSGSALAPRRGLNLAYLDDQIGIERRIGPWTLGLLARSYATVVASEDALRLALQSAAGQGPAQDTRWQASVHYRGLSGAGVSARWQITFNPAFSVALSGQWLALSHWRDQRVVGQVGFNAQAASYGLNLVSDRIDDRLSFPYQTSQASHGSALLLGAQATWRAAGWLAEVNLRDGGWLHWRAIPRQQLSLVSDRQIVDADGFVVYGPLIEGRNSQTLSTQRWPWRTRLTLGREMPDGHQLMASADHLPGFGWLPAVQWQRRLGLVDLAVKWRIHERRFGTSVAFHGLSLCVGADRLGAQSRSREFQLTWNSGF